MEKRVILDAGRLQQMLSLKGRFGYWLSGRIIKWLEIDKANAVQARLSDCDGPDFSERTLAELGVTFDIPEEQLAYIPSEGGFITLSNHHFGGVDGLILSAVVSRRRPDYKILTTFLLSLIPSLRDTFFAVDNFSSGGVRSIQGIRKALEHIRNGGALGLFPAGEVATWQKKGKRTTLGKGRIVEDCPWADNIIKLVRKSGLPVIPIYFHGENSRSFHILGRIHPRLRTIRLVHELFNKQGTHVPVRIGRPIPASVVANMDPKILGGYLRGRVYALEAACQEKAEKVEHTWPVPVAAPEDPEKVRAEIDRISDRMLFEAGGFRVYLTRPDDIPSTMRELARLREETFRAIGEGTGNPLDTDVYDSYYHHLLLWNVEGRELAGAYRVGYGTEIVAREGGVNDFYTASLFRFQEKAPELFRRCMELGRTFVIPKYQREIQPLRLLLAGIAVATTRYEETEYFFGPVSISNDYPDFYKSLIVRFLETHFSFPDRERVVLPTHPMPLDFLRVDPDALLAPVDTMDGFDRLLASISDGKYRLPVLVKIYFNSSAKLLCANVDPDFNNCLDGFIVLKIKEFPRSTFKTLVNAMPPEQAAELASRIYGD